MTFVVDSNIIFSAILNPENKIGQIIINGSKYFTFITVDQLNKEIENHEDKILKISGLSHHDFLSLYGFIKTKIKFVHQLLKGFKLTITTDEIFQIYLNNEFNRKFRQK